MKSWDAIIIGGGIIGLSLAIELRKQRMSVLVVERGEPGREASHAAAGMLVGDGTEIPPPLRSLAAASARMYPEFVHELEDESDVKIDFREQGTILISSRGAFPEGAIPVTSEHLRSIEPGLTIAGGRGRAPLRGSETTHAVLLSERSVDPRTLMTAAVKAARHRGADIASGSEVNGLLIESGRVAGIKTDKTSYSSAIAVNCAGAWAGQIPSHEFPVQPVKGQMLAVVNGPELQHVIRGDEAYLVPRSDGRIVIGSTLEEAGFDTQVDVDTIEKLFHAAIELVPAMGKARVNARGSLFSTAQHSCRFIAKKRADRRIQPHSSGSKPMISPLGGKSQQVNGSRACHLICSHRLQPRCLQVYSAAPRVPTTLRLSRHPGFWYLLPEFG